MLFGRDVATQDLVGGFASRVSIHQDMNIWKIFLEQSLRLARLICMATFPQPQLCYWQECAFAFGSTIISAILTSVL